MGKAPAKRLRPNIAHIKTKAARRQHSQAARSKSQTSASTGHGPPAKTSKKNDRVHNSSTGQSRVPFSSHDRILLIGEGDFSFALSLIKHHRLLAVTATCYDSQRQLVEKYPRVMTTIEQLDTKAAKVDDSEATNNEGDVSEEREVVFEGFSPPPTTARPSSNPPISLPPQPNPSSHHQLPSFSQTRSRVLYSIDATQLPRHRKSLFCHQQRVFNFPHVGGLSTDVNRQVRANQELLVKFLEGCKALLVPLEIDQTTNGASRRSRGAHGKVHNNGGGNHSGQDKSAERYSTPSDSDSDSSSASTSKEDPAARDTSRIPQVLITIFEGHPYTLWNIRDLARHTGYNIVESFRFPWSAYPGYAHARTLGEIVPKGVDGRRGGRSGGEEPTADNENHRPSTKNGKGKKGRWHGEDRDARTYVLELREHQEQVGGRGGNMTSGKRKRGGGDGSEDDDL
ncbi:uncharacterized protein AB675_11075 [Cyphellophora attinorum]|uniref:25S rRNA (uridine-N(3))-methyltransferase BMT5-like domain-containing protein n=1 Tax=Cyphellophora attinorum TaxID=1664694 RepID=A0A0N1H284_9EURO|nr:uncharacterized protein AB675_11075 [Phialophora attinorum]KPI34305.1 hypothetical protein AB675_11075 [Phialophora attinorum]